MTNHKSILPNTNLRQLRNRTKDLHKALEAGDPRAIRRIGESHPRFCGLSQAKVATAVTVAEVTLADAQLVIARELGFDSWPKLKARLDAASYPPSSEPGPAADRVGPCRPIMALVARRTFSKWMSFTWETIPKRH